MRTETEDATQTGEPGGHGFILQHGIIKTIPILCKGMKRVFTVGWRWLSNTLVMKVLVSNSQSMHHKIENGCHEWSLLVEAQVSGSPCGTIIPVRQT